MLQTFNAVFRLFELPGDQGRFGLVAGLGQYP